MIIEILKRLFHRPPTQRTTTAHGLAETPFAAHNMTVDRLQGILRAAEGGETEELFGLYRDILLGHAHTQGQFNTRKLAVLGDTPTIAPRDPKSPADVAAAEAAKVLCDTPGWRRVGLNHLLNGSLYPVSVLEVVYVPSVLPGLRFEIGEMIPVPPRLLDYTSGKLQIWDSDPDHGHRLTTRQVPTAPHFVTHRGHLLTDIPDNWGGPMRAVLFWWLFATMDRDWWVRFLDRFGAPFLVGKYDQADDASRKTLVRAFSAATRLFGLVVSRDTDVQLNSVATQGHGEGFAKFQEVANDELSKLILGQTMTSTAKASGIGSSQAQVQDNVRGDIRAWDAACLAETVTQQIIRPLLDANGIPGEAVLTFGTTSTAEAGSRAEVLSKASAAGLELTDEGIAKFGEETGFQFRRAAPIQARPDSRLSLISRTPDGFNARAAAAQQMSNEDLDRLAASAAPELADAFRGVYAPIRRLILESTSPDDLEQRLRSFYADWTPSRLQPILEDALCAFAANGAAAGAR